MYKLSLRLSPARSLSDVLPINNPPSLPPCSHGLVTLCSLFSFSPPIALLLSLPSSLVFLSPSSHSLHTVPLTHFSSLSLSHALSRWNSAVSPHRCRTGSNAHKRARNEKQGETQETGWRRRERSGIGERLLLCSEKAMAEEARGGV